ncbi:MAG TPA: cell division protein CrgA [Dermatophilaceae bacterium]|nr:cell division protein CrgA [Dermatophilaceae bacterium]
MPESKGRPKPAYTPPPTSGSKAKGPAVNPRWWVPVMLGLMGLGLVWVVTFYISGLAQWPVPALGRWNLGVGFGLVLVGFGMTTRWR